MNKWIIRDEWDYYPSSIFVYAILYYCLNMLDFVITRLTLEQCDHLRELNPFYYHPFFALLKPFIPVCVTLLYFNLYFITQSDRDREIIGKYGLGCLMILVFVYELICLNNILVVYLSY
jgi:hypothetical protein